MTSIIYQEDSNLRKSLRTTIFLLLGIVAYALICNMLLSPNSLFYVSVYSITLLGKYLCYALLALSVDLLWGYCGILSLGQGIFFGLGGYAMGMYLMRQVGERGVYGDPILPDFMVFLDWKELPWFWLGFDEFWFACLMILLVPGLLSFVFGWLAFRSRVAGVYFSIITQALTYAFMLAFFRNEMGFGGNNGLTDFKEILGFSLRSDETKITLFALSAIFLALGYAGSLVLVKSRFGKVVLAIRDSEERVRSLGFNTDKYKIFLFVYSAILAAMAGALYVPQVGIINPSEFSPLNSIEIVVWVLIGGRGTLYGAIIGAFLVNYAKTKFTALFPDQWLFVLGSIFILVTVFLPNGIVGLIRSLVIKANYWKRSRWK